MDWTHVVTLEVTGRPLSGGPSVDDWTDAVRAAVEDSGVDPVEGRFSVRIELRLSPTSRVNDAEDLHHLVPPVIAGLEGVLGTHLWAGEERLRDDQVDHLETWKRLVQVGEEPGATIEVWTRPED